LYLSAASTDSIEATFMGMVDRLRTSHLNASSLPSFNRCDRLLKRHCKAWQRLSIAAPFADLAGSLPEDTVVLVLQNSADGSCLYGATGARSEAAAAAAAGAGSAKAAAAGGGALLRRTTQPSPSVLLAR
jgi:hypothetical protein